MRDKKFAIMLGIIVLLSLALLYLLLIGPSIQGYVVNRQIEAQDLVISVIVQTVNQQGYVVLNTEQGQMILVPYQEPQQQMGFD